MGSYCDAASEHRKLPMVSLGKTGTRCSCFGLGGFHQVEVSSEIVEQVVDAYLAEGGNYIETARDYGRGASEEKIGRALGTRRSEVVLCSKTSAATSDQLKSDLDASLKALRTDHLEFYFFHCVDQDKLDAITASGGALEAMIEARSQGTIGGIGFTSHVPAMYLDAIERIDLSIILVWLNYLDDLNFPIIAERVIPAAKKREIAITAMKPLADGLLHASVSAAIGYCLAAGAEVAVCGTNSVQQVQQVAAAVRSGPTDKQGMARILADAPELGRYVCRRCGKCSKELMELFRLEGMFDRQMMDCLPHNPADRALRKMLSHWFGQDAAAKREYLDAGYDTARLLAEARTVDCPYGIDVGRKAALTHAKLTGNPTQLL